jgi:CRP/FNR family cyclic AMP-dependent transcriptional regulator
MVYDCRVGAPIDLLKRVPLFQGLKDRELKSLAAAFTDRSFREGEELTTEGRSGVGFFIIESGEAIVTVDGEERRTLGPTDYFGEVALIDNGTRSATITAKTPVKCYGLTPWLFRPLVEENASIAWPLLEAMAKRTREIDHPHQHTS